jgi:hypothetical protein
MMLVMMMIGKWRNQNYGESCFFVGHDDDDLNKDGFNKKTTHICTA